MLLTAVVLLRLPGILPTKLETTKTPVVRLLASTSVRFITPPASFSWSTRAHRGHSVIELIETNTSSRHVAETSPPFIKLWWSTIQVVTEEATSANIIASSVSIMSPRKHPLKLNPRKVQIQPPNR